MAKRGRTLAKKAKKKGLSLAKSSNIHKNKMAKRGILTDAQKKKKKQLKKERNQVKYAEQREERKRINKLMDLYEAGEEVYPLSGEVTGEEMMKMIDPEDLSYMVDKQSVKRKHKETQEDSGIEAYDDEQRSFDKDPENQNTKHLLPFKSDKGIIPRSVEIKEESEEEEEEAAISDEETKETEEEPKEKSTVEFLVERQKKLEEKKVKIGCLAANFIEEPEERLSGLSSLVHFMDESDPDVAITVKKYAALSLLEVFNNIIPSYSIQTHNLEEKLKKETKKLYFYENHMLSAYQIYLKGLESMLSNDKKKMKETNPSLKQMGLVALRCLGELLTKHSHFNYTTNIMQALVPFLNHHDDDTCSLVFSYLTKLFKADKDGRLSFEVVQRIDQYVRRRAFRVRPEVLKVLLGLRIKDTVSLDNEIEAKLTAKRKLTHKEKLIKKLVDRNRHTKSNKDAKAFRKKRKLEEQMKIIHKERATTVRKTHHTSVIQLVFGLFIHVLKRRPNNKLMGVVLEGLAKFAHLINIEFFADLLNVLGVLMAEGSLKFRESLHCIQVVFTILSGQGEVLTLDPHRFYKYLYANMFNLSAGTNHDDVLSALESVKQMLVERRKRVSIVRVQAFAKRLATLSLTLLHSGTIASLAILRSILLNHPSTETLLETDSEGTSGIFSAEVEEPEHSNAAATAFWELHLLMRHYHSTVRQMSEHLLHGAPLQGEKTLPYTLTKRSVDDLFEGYDPSEMRFNPAVPTPSQHLSNRLNTKTKKIAKRIKGEHWITNYMTQETQSVLMMCDSAKDTKIPQCDSMNGYPKQNGLCLTNSSLGKVSSITELDNANFFKGMLLNMNMDQIPDQIMPEEKLGEDFTLSLLKTESKSS
ncbi:nucleolar complex protein 3 homolog [Procambarus clarkii]|uniref:nucleolar complex protein 3 homolog n=1 Tax=Procambarus clarkii TaxID=6728 RepID=UPI001E6733ED|nr:nucleolar complex protein 3 homolog [Procambarus clarkii]